MANGQQEGLLEAEKLPGPLRYGTEEGRGVVRKSWLVVIKRKTLRRLDCQ